MTSALQTEPAATLARLQVKGGEFDLDAHAASMQEVLLSGLRTQVVRTAGQPLNWQEMLKQARVAPPVSERAVVKLAAGAERNWTLALQRLALEDAGVHVEDRDAGAPVLLDIERGLLEAREVTLDMARAIPLKASFQVRQGGRFEAAGRVIPKQSSGKLDLKLVGLSLKPFAPYVNRFARLNLHSGAASTRGKLAFAQAKSGMKLDYDGGFSVDDLAITEEETEEAFLGWKKLGSDNLEFSLGPDRLHMDELVATNPFGKVIIFEDKTINFKRILRSNAASAPKPALRKYQPPKPAAEAETPLRSRSQYRACALSKPTPSLPISRSRRSSAPGCMTCRASSPACPPTRRPPRKWNSTARSTTSVRRACAGRYSRSVRPTSPI